MGVHGPFEFELGQRTQLGGTKSTIVGRDAGAFGVVYVLESDEGDRVAVKTPRLDHAPDRDVFERFAEEGRVWIGLPWHPFVLEARRILRHLDRPYIEMEYVPPVNAYGSSLAAILAAIPDRGVMDISSALTAAAHVVDALSSLEEHDATFVHGDIKPANLLLKLRPGYSGKGIEDASGNDVLIMLSDFGMSRAAGAPLNASRLGDISYLAPETLEVHRIGRLSAPEYRATSSNKSTDVYAFGCTLFELLFSHQRQWLDPRTATLAFALDHRLHARQLANLRPDLDLPFAEFLSSCLDPNPAKRPRSFRELRAGLLEACRHAGAETGTMTHDPGPRVQAGDTPFGRYLMSRHGFSEDEAREFVYLMLRSGSLQSLGEAPGAQELLDIADRMAPGLASIENARASGYLALQEREAALAHLSRAVSGYESDPELAAADPGGHSAACANLAQLFSSPRSLDPARALSLAERAVNIHPGHARIQLSYGMALMSGGYFVEAARAFASGEALDPSNNRISTMRRCCDLLQETMGASDTAYPARPAGVPPLSQEDEHFARALMNAYAAVMRAGKQGDPGGGSPTFDRSRA